MNHKLEVSDSRRLITLELERNYERNIEYRPIIQEPQHQDSDAQRKSASISVLESVFRGKGGRGGGRDFINCKSAKPQFWLEIAHEARLETRKPDTNPVPNTTLQTDGPITKSERYIA